jgi:crotonobetainyl-CoA:carnitine CoA-transferase CaiB-like acyl-CoA transferase
MLMEQAMIRPDRVATGNRSQTQAPSDAFRTRDGWVLVQCIGQPLFKRWTELVGEPHWLDDPRFADDRSRGDHGAAISERMAEWCGERTTDEALAALDAARIPAGPVLSPQQVLDDAHVQAIGFLRSVASPGAEVEAPVAETPFSLSAAPAGIRGRAPGLGEHSDTILADLGYSAPAVAALHQRGVV